VASSGSPPVATSGLLAGARELLAELLDAAGFDDALLRAGIERVRLGGHVELEQRVFLPVVHLDLLARGDRRLGDELEAVRHVHEDDFTVVGVDALFHDWVSEPQALPGFWSRFGKSLEL